MKCNKIMVVIGFFVAISAIIASITTVFIVNEKKRKDDEELERYLKYSIQ